MNAKEISPLEPFRIKEKWHVLLLLYIGMVRRAQDHPFQHYATNYHMKYEIFPPRVLILQRIHVL